MRAGWLEMVRAVGAAFLEVLQAEWQALVEDLRDARRRVAGAAALFLVAAFLLFWALGALAYSGIELLVLWGLPRWGAALVALGGLLAAAAIFGLVGWLRVRRIESPADTARRRWRDHQEWWRRRALPAGAGDEEPSEEEGGA